MIQKRTISSVFFPLFLLLAVAISGPAMAMKDGHKGEAGAKHGSSEGEKSQGKKGGMHGSMGLTMTNVMPGKTMKFLDHFKSWVEITPDQEPAWSAFSKAIKMQASAGSHMKQKMHMKMDVSPVVMAEMKIAKAERMIQMKRNTLEAYKALLQVLDAQQARLADVFLAHHMKDHGSMKKQKGKGGH